MAGFAAPRWYLGTPPRNQGAAAPSTRCSGSTALLQAAPDRSGELPHPPADRAHSDRTSPHIRSPLHNQPPLRHPGSRCDIDSHPDCRPFLTLIVAPHRGQRRRLCAAALHLNLDAREELVGVLDTGDIAGTSRARRSTITAPPMYRHGRRRFGRRSPDSPPTVALPPHPRTQGSARVVRDPSVPVTGGATVAPCRHDA